jgi:hypothetical protein
MQTTKASLYSLGYQCVNDGQKPRYFDVKAMRAGSLLVVLRPRIFARTQNPTKYLNV